jgi:hypothetical protein
LAAAESQCPWRPVRFGPGSPHGNPYINAGKVFVVDVPPRSITGAVITDEVRAARTADQDVDDSVAVLDAQPSWHTRHQSQSPL